MSTEQSTELKLSERIRALTVGESMTWPVMPPKPRNFRSTVYAMSKRFDYTISCSIAVRQKTATITRVQ